MIDTKALQCEVVNKEHSIFEHFIEWRISELVRQGAQGSHNIREVKEFGRS